MKFKEELITELKKYPDLYNEVRSEIIVPSLENNEIPYVEEISNDHTLERADDKKLIAGLVNNLKYYIEYEQEIGESDI
ncbi:hypothetical protein Halha_1462 [Halobacteroides halobius DSM 5150]|uniref:Uncharacterized protein n=1 Tax=Halobacteroides halobius (strain ATCC 35273 / DSM 5150 / MD-1) TaxID=748449 RepID=L0K814_HALHC|nr:hypothetical protein [Halobacteroides halobius]AGB41407.1 hypothetical protein Halha_1462 [Halobacteroides halobius DSM 5150]